MSWIRLSFMENNTLFKPVPLRSRCLWRFMYQARLVFWLQINICLAFNSLMMTVPFSHLQHDVVWNCPCELEILTFTLVSLSQDCRLLPHAKMTPAMDKTMMYWYRSNTVAEQKAPAYSFKMSTWVKINKNYLDDDSDQMPQKTQRLFTLQRKILAHIVLLSNFPHTLVTGLQWIVIIPVFNTDCSPPPFSPPQRKKNL